MVKKTPNVHYWYQNQKLDVMGIYRRLKKRRGRALILAHAHVKLNDGVPAELVFVRDKVTKDWLAILSTDIELQDSDIVRIYGKRWDIEVFFKIAKHHLKLVKEILHRVFDALFVHTSIVFMRYMFLAYESLMLTDHRSFGDLFYVCYEEIKDITYMEPIFRILAFAADHVRMLGFYCERTFQSFYFAALHGAIVTLYLSKNPGFESSTNPES